jgi:hypothetical protein
MHYADRATYETQGTRPEGHACQLTHFWQARHEKKMR